MENHYQEMTSEMLDACYEAMASQHRSGDWYNLLKRYFTQEGSMPQREPIVHRTFNQQAIFPKPDR